MNSVTGSGNVAKCSNALPDNYTTTTVLVYIYDLFQRKGLAYSQNTGHKVGKKCLNIIVVQLAFSLPAQGRLSLYQRAPKGKE